MRYSHVKTLVEHFNRIYSNQIKSNNSIVKRKTNQSLTSKKAKAFMKISDRSDIFCPNHENNGDLSEFESININSSNETIESLSSSGASHENTESSHNDISSNKRDLFTIELLKKSNDLIVRHRQRFEARDFINNSTVSTNYNVPVLESFCEKKLSTIEQEPSKCIRTNSSNTGELLLYFYGTIKYFEKKINPFIVQAMLGTDLSDIISNLPNNLASQNKSINVLEFSETTIDSLILKLDEILNILKQYGIEQIILNQIFKQIFHYIGGMAFNSLLQRKKHYKWSKSVELKKNINRLDSWITMNKLQLNSVEAFDSLKQANQLLLTDFSNHADVQTLYATCTKLSKLQLKHFLTMYSTRCNKNMSIQFINNCLNEFNAYDFSSDLLELDINKKFPVYIPYSQINMMALKQLSSMS